MNTEQKSTDQKSVTIGGMSCTGCADTVQKAFENEEGVFEAVVDHKNDTASITYDPESVSTDDFKQIVEDAGYDFVDVT